ncbi:uncharacterized protein Dwil_GK23972 [Drosophila willistoni]|uniref:Uncharacterized protein n=1 Tax=Drosophila willistoni TaxID=7260 RepID=B4MU42_DROWI|nr:uncharacterized protein LOC6641729 [Drosophila willistoni]EDW75631.1 uncharacterized protein Dwil_GK23972 [Drosophila willistoni]
MSEPISGRGLRCAYNGLLLYSAYSTVKKMHLAEHPCAYSACIVSGTVAVLGLLRVIFGSGHSDECRKLRDVNQGVLELVPLPLVNMELYIRSTGVSPLALSHAIFVLPLVGDLCCSIVKERRQCDISECLKDLTVLGNIVSLAYLAHVEENFIYMRMMLVMAVMKYGGVLVDSIHEGTGEDLQVCGTALFLHLFGRVLREWKDKM